MFKSVKNIFSNIFSVEVRESETGKMLGVSLEDWIYLGRTDISYIATKDTERIESYLFFFLEKTAKDEDPKRKYVHAGGAANHMKTHPFLYKVVEPWVAGEYSIFYPILSEASNYLKDAGDTHGLFWDNDSSQFVISNKENVKYKKAISTQKNKNIEQSKKDNVIELNFQKE